LRFTERGTIEPSRYLLGILPHFGATIKDIRLKNRSFPRLSRGRHFPLLAEPVQHVYYADRANPAGFNYRTRARLL
jgi:hypothetical protein